MCDDNVLHFVSWALGVDLAESKRENGVMLMNAIHSDVVTPERKTFERLKQGYLECLFCDHQLQIMVGLLHAFIQCFLSYSF